MEIVTKSAQETFELGEKLANTVIKSHRHAEFSSASKRILKQVQDDKVGPKVICLYGELGSGKTTFIQGIARGLGVKQRIISPTFVFIRPYRFYTNLHEYRHESTRIFYHVDLYRINSAKEAEGLGLEEIFSDSNAIVTIEWAEKIKKFLPKKRTDIYFKYLKENERKIKIVESSC